MKKNLLKNNNTQAFISFVKAGLWKKEARLSCYDPIDFNEVFRIAKEQTVLGLLMEGIDYWKEQEDFNPDLLPYRFVLKWVVPLKKTEGKNLSMNAFIEKLFRFLESKGVEAVLLKGQGIAQCYDTPLWRSCGDIDLLLDVDNYHKAIMVMEPYRAGLMEVSQELLHYGMVLKNNIVLELHGKMHTRLSKRIDRMVDKVQEETLKEHKVIFWHCRNTDIPVPAPDQNVIFIFTHILHHLFIEGIGLRQICDWCRLLWTYGSEIDKSLLESRLREMKVLSEWKAFAAFAVDLLGMEESCVPLYDASAKWKRKARALMSIVLESGNMGHNLDFGSRVGFTGRLRTLWLRTKYSLKFIPVFPIDAVKLWFGMVSTAKRN